MSSSTTGLSRSRSLRKPAIGGNDPTQKDGAPTRVAEPRNASPSRLPQVKPLMRSNTISSAAASTRTRAPSTTTGRPLSGIFSGKTAAARRASPTTDQAPAATATRTRPPVTRQLPAASTSSNSTSTGRPMSSSGQPPSVTARPKPLGHSRAKSTATALTAATTLRPPSSHQSSTSTASTTTSTAPLGRTLARSQAHTRNLSQPSTASSQPSAASASASVIAGHRPAFNTNQQHYSPLKSHAPKPLTSTYLAPPSPSKLPSNVALSAETSRLQAELLQLSLLHRDAGAVAAEWHASAREKLGLRFEQLVGANEALARSERDGVEGRNAAALAAWAGDRRLDDKLQALDEVVGAVWGLSEPGGRYAGVVAAFEEWAARVAAVVEAQRGARGEVLMEGREVLFVSDLDRPWKSDCAGLVRKLEVWQEKLGELGDAGDDTEIGSTEAARQKSSLARVLEGCGSLVDDMLAELALMEQIEREALRAELEWVERMNKELRLDDTQDNEVLWKLMV